MSSSVAEAGILIVLLDAPEMNGWRAPSIFTCPSTAMQRVPPNAVLAQSKTLRVRSSTHGMPSMCPQPKYMEESENGSVPFSDWVHMRLKNS